MYLRFVRLKVRPGSESQLVTFHRERVAPALAALPGCLYVGLLSSWRGDDYQSLSIWRDPADAEAYEQSGLYHQLLRAAAPLLAETTRWRVQLSKDPLATILPGDAERLEIPPDGYQVEAGEPAPALAGSGDGLYLRLVSLRVAPDRRARFLELYRERVLPALRGFEGCRGALLAEGLQTVGDVLSISFWESEAHAVRYESSGEFERLTAELQETFSPVYSWKLVLGEGGDRRKQAPKVSGYHRVSGREGGGEPPAG